jgi:carboxylate-amine ligase
MIYLFARLSHRYPTIEVRAGDVCLTVDESLLIAALARALVVTAMAKSAAGGCGPYVDDRVLVAAHWRAARDGVEGQGVDVLSGELRPAWELVDRLVEYVRPALEACGDLARVNQLIEAVAAHGSGASRQRAAGGDPHDVARFIVEQTLHGIGIGLPQSTATSRFAWPSTA